MSSKQNHTCYFEETNREIHEFSKNNTPICTSHIQQCKCGKEALWKWEPRAPDWTLDAKNYRLHRPNGDGTITELQK